MQAVAEKPRKAVLRMCMVNFLYGVTSAVLNFRILYLSQSGLSATQSGLVMCMGMVAGTIAPPIWGMVADRMRSKYRVFVLTSLGVALFCALIPTLGALRLGGVLLAAILIPVSNAFFVPTQSVVDASSVSASMILPGVDYSRLRMWMSIGYTVANLALSPLVTVGGAAIPYYICAGFALILLTQKKAISDYEEPPRIPSEHKGAPNPAEVRFSRLFKNYYLMVFLIINILICIPSNCSQFIVYILEDIQADTSLVGVVIACRVCFEVLVLLISPWLKRRVPTAILMIAAAVSFCMEMLLYQFADSVLMVTLSCCFGGAAYGFVLCTAINYVNRLSPAGMQSTAVSVWLSGGQVSGMLCMLLGGAVIDAYGVRTVFLGGMVCAVLWAFLFLGSYFLGVKVLKKQPPMRLTEKASETHEA